MTTEQNIRLMENRLHRLESSEKENFGVCRKIRRNIRNLRKKMQIRKKITKMSVSGKQTIKKEKNQTYIGKKVIHNPEGVCTIAGISKLDN